MKTEQLYDKLGNEITPVVECKSIVDLEQTINKLLAAKFTDIAQQISQLQNSLKHIQVTTQVMDLSAEQTRALKDKLAITISDVNNLSATLNGKFSASQGITLSTQVSTLDTKVKDFDNNLNENITKFLKDGEGKQILDDSTATLRNDLNIYGMDLGQGTGYKNMDEVINKSVDQSKNYTTTEMTRIGCKELSVLGVVNKNIDTITTGVVANEKLTSKVTETINNESETIAGFVTKSAAMEVYRNTYIPDTSQVRNLIEMSKTIACGTPWSKVSKECYKSETDKI